MSERIDDLIFKTIPILIVDDKIKVNEKSITTFELTESQKLFLDDEIKKINSDNRMIDSNRKQKVIFIDYLDLQEFKNRVFNHFREYEKIEIFPLLDDDIIYFLETNLYLTKQYLQYYFYDSQIDDVIIPNIKRKMTNDNKECFFIVYNFPYRYEGFPLMRYNDVSRYLTHIYNFLTNTDGFKKEYDSFKSSSNHTAQKEIFNKTIFRDEVSEILFREYRSKHIIDPYVDYSFIFQQMKDDGFIHRVTHHKFMEYLKDEGFINEKLFDKFMSDGYFRSLKKSSSSTRLNNYYLIKNTHIKD